jgi:hypothetical protein
MGALLGSFAERRRTILPNSIENSTQEDNSPYPKMVMSKNKTVKSEYRNNINIIGTEESCDSEEEYRLKKEE